MSTISDIADAVAASLNNASFSQPITAAAQVSAGGRSRGVI
jgi:hypothetical protein